MLSGERQVVSADTIRIQADAVRGLGTGQRNVVGDPFAAPDSGVIREFAQSVVSDTATLSRVVQLLDAVHQRIQLDTAYAAPVDAGSALRTGRARPDGIARLFVAAARSLNLPARYVVGFAPAANGIVTHAWAEVWLAAGGGWIAVDPVLGRARASTNLIRLGVGGSSHPQDMLVALADVKLAAIDATEAQ
jgi:transglutaminase-like putative cysteine protease